MLGSRYRSEVINWTLLMGTRRLNVEFTKWVVLGYDRPGTARFWV